MKKDRIKDVAGNEEKKISNPKEKGPFSHINTDTTVMFTMRKPSISKSFARELGLSNEK